MDQIARRIGESKNPLVLDTLLIQLNREAIEQYIDPSFACRQIRFQRRSLRNKHPQLFMWWDAIVQADLRADPGRCLGYALKIDRQLAESFSKLVEQTWDLLPENARRNICYASHDPKVLNDETLLYIFEHPSNTTKDRHMLAAGVTVTFDRRNLSKEQLRHMLDSIGKHPETYRQEILERFLSKAYTLTT